MKRVAIAIGSVLLLAVLAAPFVFAPKDKELIKQALDESVKASEEGRPGGVLDNISPSLQFNEEGVDRSSVAQYIKLAKPDIKILDPTPTIEGDTATIISPVVVTMQFGPVQAPTRLDRVVITLAKETGRRYLVLPAPVWRVRSVKVDEADRALFEN